MKADEAILFFNNQADDGDNTNRLTECSSQVSIKAYGGLASIHNESPFQIKSFLDKLALTLNPTESGGPVD
jgi:hypothetical protein